MQTLRHLVAKLTLAIAILGTTAATTSAQLSLQDQPGKAPVRVSGGVMAGLRISGVQPLFPAEARAKRINGIVVMRAIIAKDGTVKSVEVISGPPALHAAFTDAVRQWRYRSYLLNGQPTEVETTITMDMQLNGATTE